jgi:integrase
VEKRIHVWVQSFKACKNLMLQWYEPGTRRRHTKSAGTADPKAAETARADLESDLNHGRYRETSRMTWERFRELFGEEYLAGVRAGTRRCYANTFDVFEEVCKPTALRAVTERTVSRFVAGLRQRQTRNGIGCAPNTIKMRLEHLHKALVWAKGQKLIPEVPAFPAVKVPRKRPQPVPVETFERLLARADDPQLRVYLLCCWLAGLRLTEAFELEREPSEEFPWVDLGRERIVLPAEFVKADEDQWVPLDPVLREALDALPRHGRKVFRFTHLQTGRPVGKHAVASRVIRLAKLAGVRLNVKALRRGFGCRYAAKVSAHVLQKLMRHSDIKVTMDYYANIDQAVEEAVLGPRHDRKVAESTTVASG